MKEVNIDTLVGPTHTHGGLAYGNMASQKSKLKRSNPKKAALEGLEKMKLLFELGVFQLVMPPHPRPLVSTLKELGFKNLQDAWEINPELLYQCSSSSAMWTANSATVSASCDSADKKVHVTIANLAANFHRSLEAAHTFALFNQIFSDRQHFTIHPPLPSAYEFFDEGAANHTRFCDQNGKNGFHLFVYGRSSQSKNQPKIYPARQTLEASMCIARKHKLDPAQVLFIQQNPDVIDLGVFHNDVIATGHENLFLFHEDAYVDTQKLIDTLALDLYIVSRNALSVADAVKSYFFNSQIITSGKRRIMICPTEVKKVADAYAVACTLIGTCVDEVHYVKINQSMKNGGGPACLRLRLPLTDAELNSIHPGIHFTPKLYEELKAAIQRYYPEDFGLADLLEPKMKKRLKKAYDTIYGLLQLNLDI
jgi:succinylarginine dihydrolase